MSLVLPCLMGDVVITSTSTVDISVVNSSTVTTNVAVDKGDWFASPVVFMQWLIEIHNASAAGTHEISMTFDTSGGAGEGKITVDQTGGATAWSVTFNTTETRDAVGETGNIVSQSLPYTMTAVVAPSFFPVWPFREYNRTPSTSSGSMSIAADGVTYTVAGSVNRFRTLAPNLDRRSDAYTEKLEWLALHQDRWRVGRHVTYYPDKTNVPISSETIGDADVLGDTKADPNRFEWLLDEKRLASFDAPRKFLLRKPVPETAGYTQSRVNV